MRAFASRRMLAALLRMSSASGSGWSRPSLVDPLVHETVVVDRVQRQEDVASRGARGPQRVEGVVVPTAGLAAPLFEQVEGAVCAVLGGTLDP